MAARLTPASSSLVRIAPDDLRHGLAAALQPLGLQRQRIKFADVVTGSGQQAVSYTSPGTTYMSTQSGAIKQTGSPFDFAIQGDAWFGIDTPAGL